MRTREADVISRRMLFYAVWPSEQMRKFIIFHEFDTFSYSPFLIWSRNKQHILLVYVGKLWAVEIINSATSSVLSRPRQTNCVRRCRVCNSFEGRKTNVKSPDTQPISHCMSAMVVLTKHYWKFKTFQWNSKRIGKHLFQSNGMISRRLSFSIAFPTSSNCTEIVSFSYRTHF